MELIPFLNLNMTNLLNTTPSGKRKWKPEDNKDEYIAYVKKSRDGKYYVGNLYADIRGNPCNRRLAKKSYRIILVNTLIGY